MIRSLTSRLKQYDPHEARSIIRLLLQEVFGMTLTDICAGSLNSLSDEDKALLERLILRLENGEPVQYVIGHTYFCGQKIQVRKGCLIPRPETEELCYWVAKECCNAHTILDIGTGSGCIAIAMSKLIPSSMVTAWDISKEALNIAKENAILNKVGVKFAIQDTLAPPQDTQKWDVIISNPPYICNKETIDMESNVLDYEPGLALFVPDDSPILFYNSIISYSKKALKPHGKLFFEINPIYVEEIKNALCANNFTDILVRKDFEGKARMICGTI